MKRAWSISELIQKVWVQFQQGMCDEHLAVWSPSFPRGMTEKKHDVSHKNYWSGRPVERRTPSVGLQFFFQWSWTIEPVEILSPGPYPTISTIVLSNSNFKYCSLWSRLGLALVILTLTILIKLVIELTVDGICQNTVFSVTQSQEERCTQQDNLFPHYSLFGLTWHKK